MGRSISTIVKYAERLGTDLLVSSIDPKDAYTQLARTNARLSQTIREQRKQLNKVNARGFGYDDFVDEYKKLIAEEKKNPFVYMPSKVSKLAPQSAAPIDKNHSEIACLALSDWHLTEVVKLADSNYINVYNSAIAANRLWAIVQKFKTIVQMHRAMYKIEKIWLSMLGDMISGSIHPEYLVTNDGTDQVATLLCQRLCRMVVNEILELGLPIEIDCVVGNHPRTTIKVPTKGIAHTNHDWVVYMFLAEMFDGDKRVKVNVHPSQIAPVYQYDHRYILEHGIDWTNGKEEVFESKIRDLMDDQIYREATDLKGTAFDQVVIGNLHKPAFLERTIKNGSLIGQNELGQNWRLKPIRAQQLMWGISRTKDRTFQYPLDVTRVRSNKVENPMSDWAVAFMRKNGRYMLLN
jgi:hypothetical protein